jgi:hypothetical protein
VHGDLKYVADARHDDIAEVALLDQTVLQRDRCARLQRRAGTWARLPSAGVAAGPVLLNSSRREAREHGRRH